MADWRTEAEGLALHLRRELRPHLSGRRFIVFGGVLVGIAGMGRELIELGGEPFLLGATRGTGVWQPPAGVPAHDLGVRASSIMEEFRRAETRYAEPPPRIQRAVDSFDPERTARSAAAFTMADVRSVAGRRRFGGRPRRWLALEDKTRVDALWRATGIPHAPSRVVRAEPTTLRRASAALDRGRGVVWAGDAKRGIHGGAEGTYWVATRSEMARAAGRLARHHDRVRVMPFLPGVPCSIHGIVLPGHTVVLRPVEMVVLRIPGTRTLRYSGVSTIWDPPERARTQMRRVARQVGEALRERVRFRGPFTIDGVLGEDGFLPTELNTRQGGALNAVTAGVPTLPLTWLCLAAIEGLDLDWQPRRMERVLLEVADRRRSGRAMARTDRPRSETTFHPLAVGARGLRRARNRGEAASRLAVGPGATGTHIGWLPDPREIPRGTSIARSAVAAFAWSDRVLDTGIGPLEPMPGVPS